MASGVEVIRAVLFLLAIVSGLGPGRPAYASGYRLKQKFRKLVTLNGPNELLDDAITSDVVPGRFLVKLRPLTSVAATRSTGGVMSRAKTIVSKMRNRKSVRVVHEYARAFEGFSFQADGINDLDSMLTDLEGQYEVLSIYPVVWLSPPDGTISEVNASALRGSYSIRDVSAPTSDTFTRLQAAGMERLDGFGVKVGLIDTGVDSSHPALRNKVAFGWDFVGNNFRAGAMPTPSANWTDCAGHGTHVAGIIAGNFRSSGFNYSGVAPGVTLGAYKVFGCSGGTTSDVVVAAMERAVQDGMQIINLSVGDEGSWQGPVAEAVNRLTAMGILVVAAAGNAGSAGLFMPTSAANANSTIAVASIQSYGASVAAKLRMSGVSSAGADVRAAYGNVSQLVGGIVRPTAAALAAGSARNLTADGCTTNCTLYGDIAGTVVLVALDAGCNATRKVLNAMACGALGVVLYGNDTEVDAVRRTPLLGSPGSWPSPTSPFGGPVLVVDDAFGATLYDSYVRWANRPPPPSPRAPSPPPPPQPRTAPSPLSSPSSTLSRQSAEAVETESLRAPPSHDSQPPPRTPGSPPGRPFHPPPTRGSPPPHAPGAPPPPSRPAARPPPSAPPAPLRPPPPSSPPGPRLPPLPRPPRPPPSPPRPRLPPSPELQSTGLPVGSRRRLLQSPSPASPPTIVEVNGTLVSPFSSWGPSPDLRLKPTVAAPGGAIFSSVPYNRTASGFAYLSGTSQAAPYVAGLLALAYEAGRAQNLNSTQLEASLVITSRPLVEDNRANAPSLPAVSALRVGAGVVDIASMVANLVDCSMTRIEIGSALTNGGRVSYQIDIQNRGSAPLVFQLQHIAAASVNGTGLMGVSDSAAFSNNTRYAVPYEYMPLAPAAEVSFNTSRIANLTNITVSSLGRTRFRVFFNLASWVKQTDQIFYSGYLALVPLPPTVDNATSDSALAAAARQPPLYLPYTGFTQPLSSLRVLLPSLPAGITDAAGTFIWDENGVRYRACNDTDKTNTGMDTASYDWYLPPEDDSAPSPPSPPPSPPPAPPPTLSYALSGPNASLPTIGLFLQRPPAAQELLLYSYPSNRLRGSIILTQVLRRPANGAPLLISWRGTYLDVDKRQQTQVSTGDYYMKVRLTRPNAVGEPSSVVMVDEWQTPPFRLTRPAGFF